MVIPASKTYSPVLKETARGACIKAGFADEDTSRVVDAVDEAVERVIDIAYGDSDTSSFHVLVASGDNTVVVKLSDYGTSFEFSAGGTIDADPRFEKVTKGFNKVTHSVNPRGGNLLTMVRKTK